MSKKNEAWDVSEHDFPNSGSIREKLEFCIRYAILAHSTYNSQPWYFVVDDNIVSVYADYRYALPVIDPDDRQLFMSCASALFNLRLAIRYFGLEENTQLIPNTKDENLIARVRVSNKKYIPSDEEKILFASITTCQLNRSAFHIKNVEKDKIEALKNAARKEGAWLYVCEGDERDIVSHFIAEADYMQISNKSFRRELAAWLDARRFVSGDGEPHFASTVKERINTIKPKIVRRFEVESGQVVHDDQIMKGSPVLAILGGEKGGNINRLYAGQGLMRVLLQAEAEGLSVSTLNQPCEVPDLRLRLHDEIDRMYGRAQYILRIGYAEPVAIQSLRRSLESVIETPETQRDLALMTPEDKQKRKFCLWEYIRNKFS
ncbi:MAG: nitroreductase [Alphaproteobacteria bacterium]|nr:nitroreductase [Alphaproteobacteria bacterium]